MPNAAENGHLPRVDDPYLAEAVGKLALQTQALTEIFRTEIADLRRTIDGWSHANHLLAELLKSKTLETERMSGDYAALSEALMKLAQHLAASGRTSAEVKDLLGDCMRSWSRFKDSLESIKHLSQGNTAAQIPPELLSQIQSFQQQMSLINNRVSQVEGITQMQPQKARQGEAERGISTWTELLPWGGAGVGISLALVAGLYFVLWRGTGLNQSIKVLEGRTGSTELRVRRIEQWLGVPELEKTNDPTDSEVE